MKAILVIDEMPKTCEECRYGSWYGSACRLLDCDTYRDKKGMHEDCPLKPLPEKLDISFCMYNLINNAKGCPLKPIPRKLDDLDLEVWNSSKGKILAPKDLFDEILGEEENG